MKQFMARSFYTRIMTGLLVMGGFLTNAQPTEGLVAKYTFNKGTVENEAGPNDAKAVGTSLATDRFGNRKSACFIQGTYSSYLNLGTRESLKPKAGTISMWFNLSSIQHNGGGVHVNPLILTKSWPGDDFYEGYSIAFETDDHK